MCVSACVCLWRGGQEQILGTANQRAEGQSVIKETVCGYLGKKCLGMHGGVGWGGVGGRVQCTESRLIAEDTSLPF